MHRNIWRGLMNSLLPFVIIGLLLYTTFAYSQSQTNYTISPPPLGYPDFPEKSSVTHEIDFTAAMIRGEDINFNGAYIGWLPRYATDFGAFSSLIGIFSMVGEVGPPGNSLDLTISGFNLSPVLELPVLQTDFFKLIFFGGMDLNYSTTSFTLNNVPVGTNVYNITFTMNTTQYGTVAGIQAHLAISENILFSPFIYIKKLQGTVAQTTDPAFVDLQRSYDIPAYTVRTMGFDILEKSSGLSLSGLMQLAGSSGDNSKVKSYIFSVGFKL